MKAIHNLPIVRWTLKSVVSYLKDTEKWKQLTTIRQQEIYLVWLCRISKILKNESNSQPSSPAVTLEPCCVVSQRYWKMKAIHNTSKTDSSNKGVVSYLKDTEKWKQFTTNNQGMNALLKLCRISKILKNESNSQLYSLPLWY